MKKTPLRSATARTADSSTRESRIDIITSPPLTSSTKGKKRKSNARAVSSSTVEKRWNLPRGCNGFGNSFPCAVSFVSVSTISLSPRRFNGGHHFNLTNTRRLHERIIVCLVLLSTITYNGQFPEPRPPCRQRVAIHLTATASFFDSWSGQSLDISQEIASPITQPSITSPTRRKPSWMSVNLESLWRSAAMMMAAVIGACSHHDPCARTTYLESRTVTASAIGSLQSLLPPTT